MSDAVVARSLFRPPRLHPLALLGLTAGALAYFIVARSLPSPSDPDADAFAAAGIGLLVAAALVVSAVPLRRSDRALALMVLGGAGMGALLTAASAPEAAVPFKALFAAGAGFALARLFFSPVLVYVLAIAVGLIDIASVSRGPTRHLIEEQPAAVDYLTLFLPHWGGADGTQLGVSDLLFMAIYLDATWRFGLRRRVTAVALVASLIVSLAIAVWSDVAVPALPLLSLALIVPNADIVWSSFRAALRG
jgi:hypothetical protein